MVALNEDDDGDFFIASGSKKAFIYKGGQWNMMTQMPTARYGLMCGPVRASPGGRVEKIVAAGGQVAAGSSSLTTVEIYDITRNEWTRGNTLPVGISLAATIEHFDFFLIMGGS